MDLLQHEGQDLAMVWLLKLASAWLHCDRAREHQIPSEGASARVTLAPLCTTWRVLHSSGEARREVLELIRELLGEADGESEATKPTQTTVPELVLTAVLPVCEEQGGEEAGDDEASGSSEQPPLFCPFVSRPSAVELLPYRLAVAAKAFRRLVAPWPLTGEGLEGVSASWSEALGRLVACPLSRAYLMPRGGNAGDRRGHIKLVAALVEHDDLLVEVLKDCLVAYVAIAEGGGPREQEHIGAAFVVQNLRPEMILASFLQSDAFDEQVRSWGSGDHN